MILWYKKSTVFVLAGISYAVGQYLRGEWFQHIFISTCRYSTDSWGIFCNSPYLAQGFALITLGETLAIIGIILLFATARAFHKWLRFSYWYIPIPAMFIIFMTPFPLIPMASLSSSRAIYDFGVIWQYVTAGIVVWYLVIILRQKIKAWKETKLKKNVLANDKL